MVGGAAALNYLGPSPGAAGCRTPGLNESRRGATLDSARTPQTLGDPGCGAIRPPRQALGRALPPAFARHAPSDNVACRLHMGASQGRTVGMEMGRSHHTFARNTCSWKGGQGACRTKNVVGSCRDGITLWTGTCKCNAAPIDAVISCASCGATSCRARSLACANRSGEQWTGCQSHDRVASPSAVARHLAGGIVPCAGLCAPLVRVLRRELDSSSACTTIPTFM